MCLQGFENFHQLIDLGLCKCTGGFIQHQKVTPAQQRARNGKPLFKKAYGLANREHRVPNTTGTRFSLGSMNKMFTSTAVMQLVESGLVKLDRPANDYLRAFRLVPARAGHRAATVRDLLTHTSGIVDYLSWNGPTEDSALEAFFTTDFHLDLVTSTACPNNHSPRRINPVST